MSNKLNKLKKVEEQKVPVKETRKDALRRLFTQNGLVEEDVHKAEQRKEHPDDIPLAIMKRKRTRDKDALVCIRLEVFENQILPKLRRKS